MLMFPSALREDRAVSLIDRRNNKWRWEIIQLLHTTKHTDGHTTEHNMPAFCDDVMCVEDKFLGHLTVQIWIFALGIQIQCKVAGRQVGWPIGETDKAAVNLKADE